MTLWKAENTTTLLSQSDAPLDAGRRQLKRCCRSSRHFLNMSITRSDGISTPLSSLQHFTMVTLNGAITLISVLAIFVSVSPAQHQQVYLGNDHNLPAWAYDANPPSLDHDEYAIDAEQPVRTDHPFIVCTCGRNRQTDGPPICTNQLVGPARRKCLNRKNILYASHIHHPLFKIFGWSVGAI